MGIESGGCIVLNHSYERRGRKEADGSGEGPQELKPLKACLLPPNVHVGFQVGLGSRKNDFGWTCFPKKDPVLL